MTTQTEAMKLASKALNACHYYLIHADYSNWQQELIKEAFTAHTALHEALAEQPRHHERKHMSTQTQLRSNVEAERLADEHERDKWIASTRQWRDEAAAELRRLVSFNNDLMDEVARLQKREWVGLTPQEIFDLDPLPHSMFDQQRIEFARAIEAKLKEKNHDHTD